MVHGRDESKHHAAAQQPICRPRLDGEARWEEGHWDEWVVCHGGEVDDDDGGDVWSEGGGRRVRLVLGDVYWKLKVELGALGALLEGIFLGTRFHVSFQLLG